jgi:chromate transport protein ChrA
VNGRVELGLCKTQNHDKVRQETMLPSNLFFSVAAAAAAMCIVCIIRIHQDAIRHLLSFGCCVILLVVFLLSIQPFFVHVPSDVISL